MNTSISIVKNVLNLFDNIFSKLNIYNDQHIEKSNSIINSIEKSNSIINSNNNLHIHNIEKTIDFVINIEKYNLMKNDFYKYLNEYESNEILDINNDNINIYTRINLIMKYTEDFVNKYKIQYKAQFLQYINSYNSLIIKDKQNIIKYNMCCDSLMKHISNSSEMKCDKCNRIISDYDSNYDDSNYDKGKTKYDSSKHCKDWLQQIQAKNIVTTKNLENDRIRIEELLKKKNIYVSSKNNVLFIPCSKIREILKELKLSIYNNHIPYMRKLITGYIPEQLTLFEEEKIIYIFEMAEKSYEILNKKNSTKGKKNPNTPYYPYFIYKILEIILEKNVKKLNSLLECIHIQSDETLFSHDNNWKSICDITPILNGKYKPTDKYKQLY